MATQQISKTDKIFVTGHRGMVGSAIVRRLQAAGYTNVITRGRSELDLLDQRAVHHFMADERPAYIFIAAAKVGGIQANNLYRADFIYQNLMIEANLIHGAHLAGVQRLMFLGSSCIYPRDCPQPIKEEYLLTGSLEQTNEPYAIAKIAGIKLCESYNQQYGRQYVSVMPTNLYCPNDNYDLANSHVLPALLRRRSPASGPRPRRFRSPAKSCIRLSPTASSMYSAVSRRVGRRKGWSTNTIRRPTSGRRKRTCPCSRTMWRWPSATGKFT